MPYVFNPIPGKPSFGEVNPLLYGSDIIERKKRRRGVFIDRRIEKLVSLNRLTEIDKQNLVANLYYVEDLGEAVTLSQGPNTDPEVNPDLSPFYQYYKIDPKGNLFGKNYCGLNNFTNYMRFRPLGLQFT